MIEQLSTLAPDSIRNARTLARCHALLDRRRSEVRSTARYTIERNLMLGFGAIYLSSLAFDVARMLAW